LFIHLKNNNREREIERKYSRNLLVKIDEQVEILLENIEHVQHLDSNFDNRDDLVNV
jgi:hypothetical protein